MISTCIVIITCPCKNNKAETEYLVIQVLYYYQDVNITRTR